MTGLGVVAVERTCQGCGAVIPPQQGSARPRKFCVRCRPPRVRSNPRVVELPDAGGESVPPDPPLVASYRRQLAAAERVDTPEGALVLHLAVLFAVGAHTAAGAASLSRELRAAMEVAMKGARTEPDRLDELSERRRSKASGA